MLRIGCSGWNYASWRASFSIGRVADFTYVRVHHGHLGRRGNYSQSEIAEWASRISEWASRVSEWAGAVDVYAYFNND